MDMLPTLLRICSGVFALLVLACILLLVVNLLRYKRDVSAGGQGTAYDWRRQEMQSKFKAMFIYPVYGAVGCAIVAVVLAIVAIVLKQI